MNLNILALFALVPAGLSQSADILSANDGNQKNAHSSDVDIPEAATAGIRGATEHRNRRTKAGKQAKGKKGKKENGKKDKTDTTDTTDTNIFVGGTGPLPDACSVTRSKSKVGYNVSKQLMQAQVSWGILAQRYSSCSGGTLTSLKFFDVPGLDDNVLSMNDMDTVLAANPSVDTVIVAVPNWKLIDVASNPTSVLNKINVLRGKHPEKNMVIAVGNEPYGETDQGNVYNAMNSLRMAMGSNLIPMSTPLAMNALQTTYPPDGSVLRDPAIMKNILDIVFLTAGPFMINIYPYFDKMYNGAINTECVLGNECPWTPFTSQLEVDVKATHFAIQNLSSLSTEQKYYFSQANNFYITETGWPSCGNIGIENNANLVTFTENSIRDVETGSLKDMVGKLFVFEANDEKNKNPSWGDQPFENCFGLMEEDGTVKQ